jgi:ribosomal protein L11 methyltransferase
MPGRQTNPADAASGPTEKRRWGVLSLEVPEPLAEELAGRLAPESTGSEIWASHPGTAGVRLYFDTAEQARRAFLAAERILRSIGREPADCGLRQDEIVDGRWVERYQASLSPFDLGNRFRVHPEAGYERGTEADGRIPLVLVPGRAFGTGEHSTTRLCAGLLETLAGAGGRWLDLGCGSGILSLVAHYCGADEVEALDVDSEAIRVARDVFAANGLGESLVARIGSTEEASRVVWDGVVANIELSFFLREAARLAGLISPGGVLVASGFLECDRPEVSTALGEAGLIVAREVVEAPWAALVAGCAEV